MPKLLRYLAGQITDDLTKKMVFVGGPRQVGKTTLAFQILKDKKGYLNWDIPEHRERILKREFPDTDIWVFDELHKYRSWRNYLKGIYDKPERKHKILVTGSARLDYYRFGGDSLQGRYHYLRLHPFSAAELKIQTQKDFDALLTLGGFPEPFLSQSEQEATRWSREYRTRLIREDLASLERIQDLGNLELLMLRLPELVGSPLSINAIRENLQISHKTILKWIMALERLYAIFRIAPFGPPRVRAIKKAQKHYHLDWSLVQEKPLRFENLVACHIMKWIHHEQDAKGRNLEIRYFRDVEGMEADFVILESGRPSVIIECKWDDQQPGKGLRFMKQRFPRAHAWQISATGKKDYVTTDNIRVCHALTFLKQLI
ncbi:MAG: ATP-binding protein [Planctomycetes bacterium]|nr:ATP-binding protein [Planctomycetota bacterium]